MVGGCWRLLAYDSRMVPPGSNIGPGLLWWLALHWVWPGVGLEAPPVIVTCGVRQVKRRLWNSAWNPYSCASRSVVSWGTGLPFPGLCPGPGQVLQRNDSASCCILFYAVTRSTSLHSHWCSCALVSSQGSWCHGPLCVDTRWGWGERMCKGVWYGLVSWVLYGMGVSHVVSICAASTGYFFVTRIFTSVVSMTTFSFCTTNIFMCWNNMSFWANLSKDRYTEWKGVY